MLLLKTVFILLVSLLAKDVNSLNVPLNDVTPEESRDKKSLDNAAAEAECLHPSSRGNQSTDSLVSDHVIDNSTSGERMLRIALNQTVQQVVLETDSKAESRFEYHFTCTKANQTYVLKVSVPRSRTLHLDEVNENKIEIHCREICAKPHANAKGLDSNTFLNSSAEMALTSNNQSGWIQSGNINVTLIGGLIGLSHVNFTVYSVENNAKKNVRVLGLNKLRKSFYHNEANPFFSIYTTEQEEKTEKLKLIESTSIDVTVVRTPKVIDTVFIVLVFIMEVVQMIALGSLVEVDDFKKLFRRPVGICAGLLCHYIIMTLLAYTVAKLLKPDNPLDAAGTFSTGLCPGSSTSNIYAYLLYGDLPLSLAITVLSYFIAFAMMPLWTYTIGREFFPGYEISIPYMDLVIMLALMLPSLAAGMLIRRKFPNSIDQVQNILTPIIILLAVGFLSTGIYASLYVFYLLDLKLAIIGCAISYTGYLLGAVIMLPFKRSRKIATTMTLEVGMKNTGIGFAFLTQTMPHPIGDIASVVTASVEVASQIPPLIVSVFIVFWELCRKKYKPVKQDENEDKGTIEENGKEMIKDKGKVPKKKRELTQL